MWNLSAAFIYSTLNQSYQVGPSCCVVLLQVWRSVVLHSGALWWMTCMEPTSIADDCDNRDFYFLFIVCDLYDGRTMVCIFCESVNLFSRIQIRAGKCTIIGTWSWFIYVGKIKGYDTCVFAFGRRELRCSVRCSFSTEAHSHLFMQSRGVCCRCPFV